MHLRMARACAPAAKSTRPVPPHDIALKVERIASLFDALDRFPMPSRDLAKHAEDVTVEWARELPERAPMRILVHLPRAEMEHESAPAVAEAFRAHFTCRARVAKGDLDELFRVGRWSLAIGLAVLAACVLISRLAHEVLGEVLFRPPLTGRHPHSRWGGELATTRDFPV